MSDFNIYCCGGFGGNIGKQILDLDINTFFIDTSISNLKNVKHDNIFLVDNIDGAGKSRDKSYQHFKELSEDILIKFKPSNKLNIIIHSLSGGSGSVIGPLIAKELISKDLNTIVVCVDSRNSIKELDNSIKTLKSYKAISDMLSKSISIFYIKNNDRKESDKLTLEFINLCSLLLDPYNTAEFDVSDLAHFLYFEKVTDNKPSVGIIDVIENTNLSYTNEKGTHVVSGILISKNTDTQIQGIMPDYLANCVVTDRDYNNEDILVCNIIGKLNNIINDLTQEITLHQENKKINKIQEINVETNTKDGLVL